MTKILLVEDDKNLREIYGTRLYAEGYDIVSAGDGEAAPAMAIKERPDLIISDVMMPKISGFDMLDILRSTTETKNIPVIMMTALSSEDQQARGEALGANRYLVKSQVGIEDVVRTVHEVLQDAPGMQQNTPTQNNAPGSRPDDGSVAVPQRQPPQQPQAYAPTPPPQTPQQPQPQSAPQPSPAPNLSTDTPAPVEATDDGALPRPIAPFSTQRPAGLGDRVIHPIERADNTQSADDVASKMAAALSDIPPQQPQAQSQPQPAPAPESQGQTPASPPQPQIAQQAPDNSSVAYDLPPVNQPTQAPQQSQAPTDTVQPQQPVHQRNPPQPQAQQQSPPPPAAS